jgi:hypothetical protein
LKASHTFIDKHMNLTLIDFGMSESFAEQELSYHTSGTFHNMAPEVIDIWEHCMKTGIHSSELNLEENFDEHH